MACVPGEVAGHFVVALEAGLVAAHAARELIVGIALVHRVATDARHLAALITGRLEQAVVLAAGHADVAVRPEEVVEDAGVFLEHRPEPRLLVELGRADDRRGLLEVVAGAVAEAVRGPLLAFVEPLHAVARAAHLRAANMVEVGRLHDGQRLGVERLLVFTLRQLGQALLPLDVPLGWPVAGFARHVEFFPGRLVAVGLGHVAPLQARRVTLGAHEVPPLGATGPDNANGTGPLTGQRSQRALQIIVACTG